MWWFVYWLAFGLQRLTINFNGPQPEPVQTAFITESQGSDVHSPGNVEAGLVD